MEPYVFAGLKVIDISSVIAGPAAATMLADFGAEVIKIEPPGGGDMLRTLDTISTLPPGDIDYTWQMDGRNRRSLVLNLKHKAGLKALHRLIAECDVYITNQPHPLREKLELTYEDIKPLNPQMIYASLTAYGEKGPERDRKGFDQLAYWARSGLMDLMRAPDSQPIQAIPGMGDHPTAVSIYAGIVTALLQREKTGKGGMVQTSLLANGLWSASAIAQGAMANADMPQFRNVNRISGAMMRPYQTKDSRWLMFNMLRTQELQDLLFTAMDVLHLLQDERFATPELILENRGPLGDELAQIIQQKTSENWMALFATYDLPVNLIATVEELGNDIQVLENRMAIIPKGADMDIPLLINHPVQVSSVPHMPPRRPPALGEHSEETLRALGYSDADIAVMRNEGTID